jgi:hypothetical protein
MTEVPLNKTKVALPQRHKAMNHPLDPREAPLPRSFARVRALTGMNLFSLWRQWNLYQCRSIGLRGVLDLFLENNPGMLVADRRPNAFDAHKEP